MRKGIIVIFLAVILLGPIINDVPWVRAQENSPDEFTLEEITVTAQKREENQQKVPIAMDVISSEEIKELGKNDIDEILSNISSALIQKAADGYRVSIRGMSDLSDSFKGQSMSPPSVALNMDGVYSNRKDTATGLFDIERVEVLYGPQSTMYSSTSPGGIVNIVTAQPKTDMYEVSGSLEYGSYNLLHTESVMNTPLSDKAAIRASFTTSVHDGYLTNGSDNEDTKSARLRALLRPNDNLSFTATAELSRNQSAGFGGGVVPFLDDSDVANPWTGNESNSLAANDQTAEKLYGQMSWDTGLGPLSMTPSYSTRGGTSDMVTNDGSLEHMKQSAREKSIELRMTSPSDLFFKWIGGVTYYRSGDSNSILSDAYLETGVGSWSTRVITEENKAFFANITYPVMDNFRLTAGYRKSWDEMISDNEEVRASEVDPGVWVYAEEQTVMSTDGAPDYKFGFEYDLGENLMLYGDYSTSYRIQGMGGPPGTGERPPEKLKAYTFGSKNRFFGNKLQVNASAYYYDYKNFQANDMIQVWLWDLNNNLAIDQGESYSDPYSSGIGDGRTIGFDLQTNVIITPKDMLNLSVAYIKSEWTDLYFDYYYTYTLVLDPATNTLIEESLLDEDYNGKPMMNTPPWSINLTYNHNFDLPNGGIIRAGITSKYQTAYRLSWRESDYPYNYQETFHMESVNAVYSHPEGKWSFSAYVNNIFNYAEKRMYMSGGGGRLGMLSIGNPRTYGAVLSMKY